MTIRSVTSANLPPPGSSHHHVGERTWQQRSTLGSGDLREPRLTPGLLQISPAPLPANTSLCAFITSSCLYLYICLCECVRVQSSCLMWLSLVSSFLCLKVASTFFANTRQSYSTDWMAQVNTCGCATQAVGSFPRLTDSMELSNALEHSKCVCARFCPSVLHLKP